MRQLGISFLSSSRPAHFFSFIADVTEYWSLFTCINDDYYIRIFRILPSRGAGLIAYVSECYLYRLREADVVGLREAH
mgnify:CR=1 FL=1